MKSLFEERTGRKPLSWLKSKKKCMCEHPIKGEYVGNSDAYACLSCKGVISGLELHIRRH